MAERGNVHDVRIGRVDAYAAYGLRTLEPEMPPGCAGVGGPIHAVALHHVAAKLHFAHAQVDDIRVRRSHRDGADR